MAIKNHHIVCALFALAAAVLLYYTMNNDGSNLTVPQVQTEASLYGGVGNETVSANMGVGTALDMRPELHFYAPGFPGTPCETCTPNLVTTRHRYPVVPGGNLSTVMHHGWGALMERAPDNNWFLNPPEAAVI